MQITTIFSHCADHHMSYVVILMHNTVVYIYVHSYKINILICNSKICWISKETLMHNSDTIISHCICHSIVKLLYIWEGKKEICSIRRTWNWRTQMHITMYYHYAHWTVCMYFIACYYELLMLIYMNFNIDICCICEWTLNKYMCNIWEARSILVLCSSTVKEPVPVIRVYPLHSITLECLFYCLCIFHNSFFLLVYFSLLLLTPCDIILYLQLYTQSILVMIYLYVCFSAIFICTYLCWVWPLVLRNTRPNWSLSYRYDWMLIHTYCTRYLQCVSICIAKICYSD